MAKKNGKKNTSAPKEITSTKNQKEKVNRLHPETKKSIWAISLAGAGIILALAGFDLAGPAGKMLFGGISYLVGWGYVIVPLVLFFVAGVLAWSKTERFLGITLIGAVLFVLSSLGLIEIFSTDSGGLFGLILGSLKIPFGAIAASIVNFLVLISSVIMILNAPLRLPRFGSKDEPADDIANLNIPEGEANQEEEKEGPKEENSDKKKKDVATNKKDDDIEVKDGGFLPNILKKKTAQPKFVNYIAPPLDLLKSTVEKPTTGDLRANANIIKRTLESFGIVVEMGEINIGPKVTRYTLKPAEGVKLSRIEALDKNLSLALSAHPIRIEAPIPGKSSVGIEVPNRSAAIVRLGSLMTHPDFHANGPLGFCLGRDVAGEPIFANIEKMPHMLVAGGTGSGKSVAIHSLIISLLYKNSPADLKFIMIDPKRVELSMYENIPHLASPVVTQVKKSIGVFRWALAEMDKRYEILQKAGRRDIKSYNSNIKNKEDSLPFIVIVVDELADIMSTYGRDVEGSIVRLAQMARAVGIHLVLATQRPSVEVITGLIKANISSRVALKVASQVDSRTILDTAGADKLLGGGDMLFMSAQLSKPKRIQGTFISEEEINSVADFIRENNGTASENMEDVIVETAASSKETPELSGAPGVSAGGDIFDNFLAGGDDDDDDPLYEDAVKVVVDAQKASTSFLQRHLKVGYARAARLMDIMEKKGVVGPGEGAKAREVYVGKGEPPLPTE